MERASWLPSGKLSVGRKKLAATTLHDTTVLFGGGFKSGVEPAGYRAEVDIVTIGPAGTVTVGLHTESVYLSVLLLPAR